MLDKNIKHHSSWEDFIKNSKYLDQSLCFVNGLTNYTPCEDKVFRFFETDVNNAKCVILGMDPYPSTYKEGDLVKNVATGRSFEVANITYFTDKYKQTSLANIFKSLVYLKYGKIYSMDEIRSLGLEKVNIHEWFDKMEAEGVIFLNATLTTAINLPDSHFNNWKDFMNEVLKYMVKVNNNLMWLVWGKNALDRVGNIVNKKNIIYSCHPASRMNNNFVSECCFAKIRNINWL